MDRNYYKSLAQEQLDVMNFYTKHESNKDRPTMIKIKNLTSRFEGNLTKNEIDYLTNFEVKTSNFYGLPKIHKSKEIQDEVKNATLLTHKFQHLGT